MDNIFHFLNYSLDKGRKIVLIYLDEDKTVRKNVRITAISDDAVQVMIGKKEKVLSRDVLLGAGYARGDDGDLEKD